MLDYTEGDTITYTAFGNELRTVEVTCKFDDVKNGQPGFDGIMINAAGKYVRVWGYDYQIVSVN